MMKTYRYTLLILLYLASSNVVFSQKIDTSKVKLTFKNESQLRHQGVTSEPYDQKIHTDHVSDIYGNPVEPRFEKVTDEPFRHAAFYTLLSSKAELYDKYSIDLDLLFEHRGISYGIYSTDNIVAYPYYKFGLDDDINILNQKFEIKAEIGSFRNVKVHQGLKIYNIDFQGADASITWRNLKLQFIHIGDLGNGIGLGLDELYDYSLGYKVNTNFQLGFSFTKNYYSPTNKYDLFSINQLDLDTNFMGNFRYHNAGAWLEYNVRNSFNVYAQFDVRTAPFYNLQDNSGILLGFQKDIKGQNYSITFNSEFRYYGWTYNYGHRDTTVFFRKSPQREEFHYSNTVGDNLYPLMNFNNNFSQWAIYTDYQYQNIAGLEFRVSFDKQIYKRFYWLGNFESCTLFKEYSEKPFNYIFYDSHISYRVDNFFEIGYGISNKAMNLDKHYHTFYMRQTPVSDFYIICRFGNE